MATPGLRRHEALQQRPETSGDCKVQAGIINQSSVVFEICNCNCIIRDFSFASPGLSARRSLSLDPGKARVSISNQIDLRRSHQNVVERPNRRLAYHHRSYRIDTHTSLHTVHTHTPPKSHRPAPEHPFSDPKERIDQAGSEGGLPLSPLPLRLFFAREPGGLPPPPTLLPTTWQ